MFSDVQPGCHRTFSSLWIGRCFSESWGHLFRVASRLGAHQHWPSSPKCGEDNANTTKQPMLFAVTFTWESTTVRNTLSARKFPNPSVFSEGRFVAHSIWVTAKRRSTTRTPTGLEATAQSDPTSVHGIITSFFIDVAMFDLYFLAMAEREIPRKVPGVTYRTLDKHNRPGADKLTPEDLRKLQREMNGHALCSLYQIKPRVKRVIEFKLY